jgi:phytoene dehydrogenase-like protein
LTFAGPAGRARIRHGGAATHPGGSVIALNGRNAAAAVLADSGALLRQR